MKIFVFVRWRVEAKREEEYLEIFLAERGDGGDGGRSLPVSVPGLAGSRLAV